MADATWKFAPDVDAAARNTLAAAFTRPDRLRPLPGAPQRPAARRRYGLLACPRPLPFQVFAKVFSEDSPGRRLRLLLGRSDAACEFRSALRLRQAGLPVPRPLALAVERPAAGSPQSWLLMEFIAGGRPLSDLLAAGAGDEHTGRDVAEHLARLIVDLAARGFWHKDLRPANIMVGPQEQSSPAGLLPQVPSPGKAAERGGMPTTHATAGERGHATSSEPAVVLLDVRHAVAAPSSGRTLERMLAAACGFLLAEGADAAWVRALAESAVRLGHEAGLSLPPQAAESAIDRGRAFARDLAARAARKGAGGFAPSAPSAPDNSAPPGGALDAFARRYGSAADAASYRDRRFARSSHQQRIDAAERRIVGQLLRDLAVRGPVLDVPCGAGRFLPILEAGGRAVIGADASADMLRLAHAEARRLGDEAGGLFVLADARRLPVADGAMEFVLCMRLLHRVPDAAERAAVLRELARVGRRWVVFSFYNSRSLRGLRERLRGRYAGETCGAIAREAAEAGLGAERFLAAGPGRRQMIVLCRKMGGMDGNATLRGADARAGG